MRQGYGDSGGAARRKVTPRPSIAHDEHTSDDSLSDDTDRGALASGPGGSHSNTEEEEIPQEERISLDSAPQSSTANQSVYPTGEDALAWNDCLQDFFKTDEDTARSIQESWPNQLDSDIIETSIGWLKEVESNDAKDVFQFVHDSIRQFLMAVWVAHTVRTRNDCTELLRVCAEKSDHLPITCCSLAHLLSMTDSPTHLQQFVTLLMQKQGGSDDFNHLLPVVTTSAETNQLDALSPFIENLFPDKTLDLSALPEISLHGLHCLTQLIRTLASLPPESTEAGKFPPLKLLSCTNCKLTSHDIDALVGKLQTFPNLREIDLSHNDIADEAVPGLSEGLGPCQNLTKVNLSHNKLSDRGDFLPPLPNLEEIDLSHNNISDEAVPGLSEGLGPCQNLMKVNLSHNKLSDRGDFLPPLPNLEEIDLSHNNISDETVPGLAEGLSASRQNLKKVNLSHNNLSDRGDFLPPLPNLEEIDLSYNGISDEAVPGLAEGLGSCQNLRKINLSYNKLSDMRDFLPPLPNLEMIDLSNNDISDMTVPGLAQGLASCQSLNHVHLNGNKISNKGALMFLLQDQCKRMQVETTENNISNDLVSLLADRQNASQVTKLFLIPEYPGTIVHPLPCSAVNLLLQFLPQLPNLQELALCVSCQGEEEAELTDQLYGVQPPLRTLKLTLRDWSLDKMARLLKLMLQQFPLLEAIDLSHNTISDEAVPGLAEGLGSCQNLKKVNLSYNELSDRGDFLPPLPNLEEIDLSHNTISDEAVPGLAAGLAPCQNLKKVNLSHNKLSDRGDFLPPLPNLEEIDLSHNNISDEAVPGLAEGLGSCENLKIVHLTKNKISHKGALLLLLQGQYKQLQLEIEGNYISGELVSLLCNIKHASQVTKLDLIARKYSSYVTPLRISDVHVLLQFLPQLPNLQELALCVSCQVGEEAEHINRLYGVRHLLKKLELKDWALDNMIKLSTQMFQHFRMLEELDLSYNAISDEAVFGLAEGLGSCQALKKVDLSYNMLSDRGDFLPPLPNLEEIDLSHNVISDEAVPGLAKGLASCQKLKKVNLSHNKLSNRGDFLPPLPNLEEIDLSHNEISDEAVPGLAERFGSCQSLKHVHLTDNKISNKGALMLLLQDQCKGMQVETARNNISDDLVSLLADRQNATQVTRLFLMPAENLWGTVHSLPITAIYLLLQFLPQLPNLQELALCVSCQGEEEAEHINQLYGLRHLLKKLKLKDWSLANMIKLSNQMLQHLLLLEEIDLSWNDISDEAVPGLAEGLVSCQKLKKVNLSHNKLTDRGDFLPPLPNLEEIDLSHNTISDEAVPGLAEGLDSCQNLKKVNLSHNNLSDRGDFLPPLPNLEEIDLSHNVISDEAVPGLAQGLDSCQNLKKVDLSYNKLSDRGDFLPPLPKLEEIDLSHNNISDEAVPGLAKGLASCQCLKKGDSLPPLPNLEEIDLSYIFISDEAVPNLTEGLGSCQNLKKVNLSYNDLFDRGDFLPPLPNLEEIDLSHNNISDDAVPGLAKGLSSCENLKTVDLFKNDISNKGALLLLLQGLHKQLQLENEGNEISSDLESLLSFRKDVGQFLPQLPNQQELALCVSCQGEEEAEHIKGLYGLRHLLKKLKLKDWSLANMIKLSNQMLQHLLLLEEIDLSWNDISDEAVPGLAECLGSCQNLLTVNLSHNKLSDRGDFLPPLPNLEEIDLSHNAISDEAVPGLAEGLGSCQNLTKVDLECNMLSDVREVMKAFINLPNLTHVLIDNNSIRDESLPAIAAWLKVRTAVEKVYLYANRFSADGVRDFVRTMKGKAYRWFSDDLLYDGSLADVGEAVEAGGEGARREEQQWERLRRETGLIDVKVRQLTVEINHKGYRSTNTQLSSP
ncbi:positive regulation of MHC class I biosynthetic process [Branchiostoma belcheri]|nr:positive regulation of MHC class I biosynthetic process [Branchiostoma belcheri]